MDKDESSDVEQRCGRIRSSEETAVMEAERRDSVIYNSILNNQKWEDLMNEGKSFEISRHQVLEAYKSVKANHGAGGVDGIDFEEFEKDLKNNLYKFMHNSDHSYFFSLAGTFFMVEFIQNRIDFLPITFFTYIS
jgi:RNA-directed DNA polymerase